ncbi:OsmC family peroxiredoxin [Curtobacterium flaccumfaciens pv. flaccumfaciens]|uniref:OsmC family peroxiredoxin n=1 Tax=Curtobacterium flaccumfaciens TaxID=2035 RepID=UPI003AB19A10
MKANGSSNWRGDWRTGEGTMSTASVSVDAAPYTFQTRFEQEGGVGPEELLAAGHAGCFNQALANNLGQNGHAAAWMETAVSVDFGIDDGLPTIRGSHISVRAAVPGISDDDFQEWVRRSAKGCTISRVLTTPVTVEAVLA